MDPNTFRYETRDTDDQGARVTEQPLRTADASAVTTCGAIGHELRSREYGVRSVV